MIDYQPILPGQKSPFKVMQTWNPAMHSAKIAFKHLMGGSIAFKEVDVPKPTPRPTRGADADVNTGVDVLLEHIQHLARTNGKGTSEQRRVRAAAALGQQPGPLQITVLANGLRSDPSETVRIACVAALRKVWRDHPEAHSALQEATESANPRVSAAAKQALTTEE